MKNNFRMSEKKRKNYQAKDHALLGQIEHLYISLSLYLCIYLSIYLSLLSLYLYIYLSIYLSLLSDSHLHESEPARLPGRPKTEGMAQKHDRQTAKPEGQRRCRRS